MAIILAFSLFTALGNLLLSLQPSSCHLFPPFILSSRLAHREGPLSSLGGL